MRFAGQRQRHHRASVKCVFECDHGRATSVRAGDLDCVFDGFGASIQQNRLLWKFAGCEVIETFGELYITFVRSYLRTGVKKLLKLRLDR